jgi:hypothetical protein
VVAGSPLSIRDTIDSLDGDHVTVDNVHDPVPADPQAVVPAAVESRRRVWVSGQGRDSCADGAHAILVAYVTAR